MGMIIAKFRRKKSNSDLLEKLDKQITSIENFQRNTEQQRIRIVKQFLVGSVGIYILSAILFYFYFYPQNFKESLLYLGPFILAPAFIFFMKGTLSWYFNRKLTKNQKKIIDLRAERKKILENIMETETYKVARELLEKYAPDQVRRVNIGQELTPVRTTSTAAMTPLNQAGLRNRILPNSRLSFKSNITQTPSMNARGPGPSQLSITPMNKNPLLVAPINRTPMPMPRYIPSKDRSFLDKMVDYLIGDGPNNRYALICKQCSGHNGMALTDEFEYVAFKCCYCMALNPARKVRPTAPKLQFESPELPPLPAADATADDDTSESEKNSGSESDGENDARSTPTLETLYRKQVESKGVGNDEATVSSDNEPNDFDKLSDLENRDSEVEAKEDGEGQTSASVPRTIE